MSSPVETPTEATAAAPESAPRQCPRCGAGLRPEQDWCLNCGAGVGARVVPPRGWRWPVALVAGLLVLAAAAFALALVELAGDAEQVSQQPAAAPTATPSAPVATATPAPTSTDPSQLPPASGGTAASPEVSDWPAGKTGYTVVLDSSATRQAADSRAKELADQGIPVGVIDTTGYRPVAHGRYVVFSGQYETRADARVALQGLTGRIEGAKVGRIAPA